jgi:drug/metabolite transporter (DMT)-like permease
MIFDNPTILFLALMVTGTVVLGVYDVMNRKYILKGVDDQLLLGVSFTLAGILLFPVLYAVGIPEIKEGFVFAMTATVLLNVVAQGAFYRAFKLSEVSLIAPLRLITAPLVIVTGFFILGEVPTWGGVVGIFITIFGLWVLFQSVTHGEHAIRLSKFFRADRGMLLGLLGSFLFAFTFVFDKQSILTSSALLRVTLGVFFVGLITIIWNLAFRPSARARIGEHLTVWWKPMLVIALLIAVSDFLTMQALNYSLAAYAVSVKRLWSLWAVIFAGYFLHEKGLKKRLVATVVMFGGIVIMVVFG